MTPSPLHQALRLLLQKQAREVRERLLCQTTGGPAECRTCRHAAQMVDCAVTEFVFELDAAVAAAVVARLPDPATPVTSEASSA